MINPHREGLPRVCSFVTCLAAILIMLAVTQQVSATMIYTARYNSGTTPQSFFYETEKFSDPTYPTGHQIRSIVDQQGIRSLLTVKGTNIDNVISSILVDDVIFTSTDPNMTSTIATFDALFNGSAWSTNSGGGAHADGALSMGGAWSYEYFNFPDISNVSTPMSVTASVPIGVPVTVYARLDLKAAAPLYHTTAIDFMNSLSFDANSVFTLENGVSVNSASWGLIENRLGSVPVPEPSTAWLLGGGILGFVVARRRSRLCKAMA